MASPDPAAPAPTLQRGLGLVEATALIVGGTIGVSIFVVPAGVANEVGAPGLALVTWAITGLMAICGALAFAELAAAMPETGGTYVFLKRAYPRTPVAFLFGWMLLFTHSTGSIAVVSSLGALYAGHFLGKLLPYGPVATKLVAIGLIAALTALNVIGVRAGARVQNVLSTLKVALFAVVVVACFLSPAGDPARFGPLLPAGESVGTIGGSVAAAMIMSIFSFNGWLFITHVAGEVKDPARTLPRSIMIAVAIVLVTYLALNAAVIYVLPFDQLRVSTRVAAEAMEVAVGPRAADLTALVILLSAIGTLNAQLLNYPRVTFALASDGLFFKRVARVDPERKTPVVAILVVGAWAAVFAASGSYSQILSYVSFCYQTFMALTVAGLIVLRFREPELPRPYRVTGYPVTPLIYLSILAWYLVTVLQQRFWPSMVGVAIVVAGLPFYFYWRRQARA
ncbi:MAG: amino acid permease [Gemmatimonadetes bacterium]|nr:amino acid permease [Gemmatimonadota bacterium]